jgi:hypothetical protein
VIASGLAPDTASQLLVESERRCEQALDQRLRRLAAGAVRERDPLVPEARALGSGRLDDPQHALLSVVGGGAHAT